MSEIARARHTTLMGGIVIDLVSAPIDPGVYHLRFDAVLGGMRAFIPACARVQVGGPRSLGGAQLHDDQDFWREMQHAFSGTGVKVPANPPQWAVEPYEERPVTLHIAVTSVMGGAAIHQLEPESDGA
jgi:hypothetical protein